MENLLALIAVVAVLIPGGWWVSHTRLVAARNDVAASWADVDTELHRRHELVPRLVTVVQAAAGDERELLVDLSHRNDEALAAPADAAAANRWEPPVAAAISQVIALRERYPALNSQQNFIDLQRQLASIEDRIAAARRFYNTRVEHLNRRVEAFPSGIVARRHGFEKAAFFDT